MDDMEVMMTSREPAPAAAVPTANSPIVNAPPANNNNDGGNL